MKKTILTAVCVLALPLAACSGMNTTEQRTLSGAAIGTGVGAGVAAVTGGCVGCGAAIGAAAGAASGYIYDNMNK
ncbi:MAG TPA: YMGG-like glycine zipper-containing protein [Alphaproteobacteria bacterium]